MSKIQSNNELTDEEYQEARDQLLHLMETKSVEELIEIYKPLAALKGLGEIVKTIRPLCIPKSSNRIVKS